MFSGYPRDGEPVAGPLPTRLPEDAQASDPSASPVWVLGGFCGHGMPRCFGVAEFTARRLLGLPLDDMDARASERFDVRRFF